MPTPTQFDRVLAAAAVDGDAVELAVGGGAAGRRQVDSHQLDVGAREVVDRDVVDAALGLELDGLDVVDVHDDVADVAGEEQALAVGQELEVLAGVVAVEEQGVGAVLALDDVAAVARIPLEYVVAGAEEGDVVALVAVDEVVAVAAEQGVGAVAAEDGVVAGAAVEGERDQRGQVAAGDDQVVAAVGVEDEFLGGADIDAEGRGVEAVEAHPRAVGGDGEDLVAVAAVDLGGVGAVAALEQVGVVAGVPDHAVVAGAAEHLIVAVAADEGVVAVAAEQCIVAETADDRVVAGAAVEGELDRARRQRRGVDAVVAAEAVDHERSRWRPHGRR